LDLAEAALRREGFATAVSSFAAAALRERRFRGSGSAGAAARLTAPHPCCRSAPISFSASTAMASIIRRWSALPVTTASSCISHSAVVRFSIGALSRSHEVWILDLPGSDYTDKPATFPYTHRSYAEFVRDFMTTMDISTAAVAGHSLGGAVALEFSLDFPERTAGLILTASGGYPREESGALNLLVHRPLNPPVQRTINAILMSFGSYPFIVKGFYSFLYHDPTPFARDAELVQEACDINRTPNAWDAMYRMQGALNSDFAIPDVTRIKAVTAPALII